ncbi:hypothetical protein D3C86_1961280 [compost metagenome]
MTTSPEGRREIARIIGGKLADTSAEVAFILPLKGIQEWDQLGEPLHEPDALDAFIDEMRRAVPPSVSLHEIDSHINAPEFSAKALAIFDDWIARGVIPGGRP